MLEDPFRDPHHLPQVVFRYVPLAQPLVAFGHVAPEIERPVPVNLAVRQLDLVEYRPYLAGAQRRVIEERGELVESLFEVDVVFPQRVIGVDDQVLTQ